jgi:hypothetical protein
VQFIDERNHNAPLDKKPIHEAKQVILLAWVIDQKGIV